MLKYDAYIGVHCIVFQRLCKSEKFQNKIMEKSKCSILFTGNGNIRNRIGTPVVWRCGGAGIATAQSFLQSTATGDRAAAQSPCM